MYLIAYDIENDGLRNKTAAKLLELGCIRLQKSVFAGALEGVLYKQLEAWLKKRLAASDKLLILDVGGEQLKAMKWMGDPPEEWILLTDPPDVLFL